jgi:hypothetical protein
VLSECRNRAIWAFIPLTTRALRQYLGARLFTLVLQVGGVGGKKMDLIRGYKVRRSISTVKAIGDEVIPKAAVQPKIKKIEIYEALYGLNAGIQQFLDSLDFLDRAGLGIPFLNGYRILADEIRSAINFSTTEAMTVVELLDYQQLENLRARFAFPPINMVTETEELRVKD